MKTLPLTLALLSATSSVLLAQAQPAPTSQPTSQPSTQPTTQPVTVWGPNTQITLNFRDASIDAVLEYLSASAGFVIIKESPVSGRVTLLSKSPVSPDEAVSLLNSVLKQTGYTAVQMGRVLKITSRDRAKRANIPVRFGVDPAKVAQTDELITQVIPVGSMDAVKLKADLQPLIGPDADWSANGASNTLIMTDTSANIRRVVEIVASMDKRETSENSIKVKQLKYADAASAAKLITDIFKTETPASNQGGNNQNRGGFPGFGGFGGFGGGGGGGGGGFGGGRFGGFGGNAAATPAAGGSDAARQGRVTASSDSRTNTVVVTGPTATLAVIDKMLEELDANPTSEQTFFIYPLRNGQAAVMAQVLNNLFGTGSTGGNRSGTTNNNRNTGTNNRTSSFGGASGGRTSTAGGGGGSGGGFGQSSNITRNAFGAGGNTNTGGFGGGGGGFGQNFGGNLSSGSAAAATSLQGQAYVVADADTNALLVSAPTKLQENVREIIAELDRAVPQVLIKVLVAEVSHNNSSDLGTDFSILNLYQDNPAQGQTAGTVFGAPTNGLRVSVLEENVQATLHALATAGKIEVLSRPYILASDNQPASINVGQRVPIITDSRLDTNNNPINQISYQDIGIILNITPHINPDGLVICDVSPEVSSFSDQTVPISSTVNAPVFNNRSADTRIGIKNGETIVIGGLMEDRKTSTVQKVPLLGDIPYLGALFSRTQSSKTKTELLFFLTPHVAASPEKLQKMSQDEAKSLKLVPDAIEPGTYKEQLEGLQRGNLNQPPGYNPIPIPETDPQKNSMKKPTTTPSDTITPKPGT